MSRTRSKDDVKSGQKAPPSPNGVTSTSQPPTSSASPKSRLSLSLILSILPNWSLILSLIFLGCCSNAYFLELSTSVQPRCGTLLTFVNFLLTALVNLASQLVWHPLLGPSSTGLSANLLRYPTLAKSKVPISRWMVQVLLYFVSNILNNTAFAFKVPMPVHIIFRSGGLVVNMIVGRIVRAKRYSPLQVASVLLVTFGVLLATLATSPVTSDSASSSSTSSSSSSTALFGLSQDALRYLIGVSLLFLALVLSSLMGLYQELTFAKYGSEHWREALFYSHALSIPLFALRWNNLTEEWAEAVSTRPMWVGWDWTDAALAASASSTSASLGKNATGADAIKEAVGALGGATAVAALERRRLAPGGIWDLQRLALQLSSVVGLGGGRIDSALSGSLGWLGASLSSLLGSSAAQGGRRVGIVGGGLILPSLFPPLVLNVLTQLLCINGVNRLTSQVSSLTVTLVLVVRKAVSLAISVLVVKQGGTANANQDDEAAATRANWQLAIGAALVLGGTVGYAMGSTGAPTKDKEEQKEKKE